MHKSTLYIIGNGFDIYHGVPSRYSNFKEYLLEHDKDTYNHVDEYITVEDDWSDLEIALAYLNIDTVLDYATNFLQPYSAEDWSDAYHHDYQYEIENIISSLSTKLKNKFCNWLQQLAIPSREDLECKLLSLDQAGLFLNFNYTATLQYIYGIPKKHILFLHGEIGVPESEIILGHAWNPTDIPNLNDVPNPEEMETRVMEGNEMLNEYFNKTFKPTDKIIKANKSFFDCIGSISEIRVLGHSLSEVDFAYIEMVSKSVDPDAKWKVSYYRDTELNNHKSIMKKLNVVNVEYCKLPNI